MEQKNLHCLHYILLVLLFAWHTLYKHAQVRAILKDWVTVVLLKTSP